MKKNTLQKTAHKAKDVNIVPLGDRVLLRPVSLEDLKTTVSGIIIPDTVHKEKPEHGIVIAVGEGKMVDGVRVPLPVKVGDRVVFSRYGYDEIKIEDEEFYILKEENLLAIIKN